LEVLEDRTAPSTWGMPASGLVPGVLANLPGLGAQVTTGGTVIYSPVTILGW
jgi:hypothetical protein